MWKTIVDYYHRLSPNIKSSIVIVVVLIIFLLIMTRKAKKADPLLRPKGLLLLMEIFVSWINSMCKEVLGPVYGKKYASYVLTLGLFIFISNIAGLFGLTPPTANICITVALGVMTGVVIHSAGIKTQGLKDHLKGSFLSPSPLLLPLNLIGEFVTPFSLGLRLFGNIMSGAIIVTLAYGSLALLNEVVFALGSVLTILTAPFLHAIFDVFFGAIQAYVFMFLTVIYISGKLPEE